MVLYALARECFGKYDVREQLAELAGLPTLVIAGKFDVITSPSMMKTIADGIAGARLEVFDRSGHFPFVEEHDKFIEMVSAFLSAERAGPGAPASPSNSLP